MDNVNSIEEAAENAANELIKNVYGRGLEYIQRGCGDSNVDNMRDGFIAGFKAAMLKPSYIKLEVLKHVKFRFGLHSDASCHTNGYQSLCDMIDKESDILQSQQPEPIEEADEIIYRVANPKTESGTWYRDQGGNDFYLQKVEQSQKPEIPDFIQPKDIDEYFKNKKEFDDIGWTGQYSLCNKDILDFIIDFKLKKYYEV